MIMTHRRRWAAAVVFLVLVTPEAHAIGSRVLPKSDGSPDGLYYALDDPLSPRSAYITEYLAGDFDPGDVIIGARVADYGPGSAAAGVVAAELRFEDPQHPGFPDFSESGLVAMAGAGLESPCGSDPSFRREVQFDPVEAPSNRALYLVVRLPGGASPQLPCGLQLDTSSPPTGAAKAYLGSTDQYLTLRANHLAEVRVLRNGPQDLGLDVHGVPRYPGDAGRPIVFARRANAIERLSDDFVALDIVVDNAEPQPVSLFVDVLADVHTILPGRPILELTSRFKSLGSSGRLDALHTFGRGRTIIKTVLRRDMPRWALGVLPNSAIIRADLVDPAVPSVPRDTESEVVGLRPAPAVHDDATTEQIVLVTRRARPGDSLAVRFPLADLPRVPFSIRAVEVVGCTLGPNEPLGYDAVEIRREDPILRNTPDLSAEGLLRTVGHVDGVGEARMTPNLVPRRFPVETLNVDPAATESGNLWARVVLVPRDSFADGTVVGADLDAPTLLGDSFYSEQGGLPFRLDAGRNYQVRLVIDEWEAPLEADNPSPIRPLSGLPGGFTAGGGPRPISVISIAGGTGGGGTN